MLPRAGLATTATLIYITTSALAFKDTSPFVLRSNIPSIAVNILESLNPIASSDDAYSSLKVVGCDWDALLVVDVEGLHQSHLKSNPLQIQILSSHQTLVSIPYVTGGTNEDLKSGVNDWVESCFKSDGVDKVVEVVSVGKDEALPKIISNFITDHPSHLILLTGHPTADTSTTTKRQMIAPSTEDIQESIDEMINEAETIEEQEEVAEILDEIFGMEEEEDADNYDDEYIPFIEEIPIPDEDLEIWDNADGYYDLLASSNSSFNATGPLLQHAQLFTTPIITALLITFGIFIPILMFGVSALAGIQVPPQMMSIAKTMYVSQSKKEQ